MSQMNQEQEDALKSLYNLVAVELISKKRKSWELRKQLVDDGVDEKIVNQVIDSVRKKHNNEVTSKGYRNMAIGGIFCFGGIAVTLFTIFSSNGGSYIVAYGAIIFGGIQFYQGYSLTQQAI